LKKLHFFHLCQIVLLTFSLLVSTHPHLSYAQQTSDNPSSIFSSKLQSIPEGSITPIITNGLEEAEIEEAFKLISNQQLGKEIFLSFVSDQPSEEELSRVEKTERLARIDGYKVERIVIPVNEVTGQSLPIIELNFKQSALTALNEVKTYLGSFSSNVDNKPEDISKIPTPVERKLAIMFPLKSAIIKPLAWSAHTGAVGVAAVTLLSVTYGYFISVYWHAFRVFFNTPHGFKEGSKLSEALKKINLAELAKKMGLKIKSDNIKNKLTELNGKKIAEIVQYGAKKFAFDLFNGELYKIVSMQGGFFTGEFHWHVFTSKLFALSYYPVSWLEDHLVLNRLMHRDSLMKLMVLKSYIGGALGTWDLAGGHIPILDVRPGVILIGFNAAVMIGYLIYRKVMIKKLGLKDPRKFKEYVEHKNNLETNILEKISNMQEAPKWETNLFYDLAAKEDSIEAINKAFELSKELILEINAELSRAGRYLGRVDSIIWGRKLKKIKSFEQLKELTQKLETKYRRNSDYHGQRRAPLRLRGNCLPALQIMFR